jgi:hypothetical protein
VAEPWQDVLVVFERLARQAVGRPIGRDENFFEAGLTSLSLVRLHEECVRGLANPFPVTALFAHPNLRELRRFLENGARRQPSRVVAGGVRPHRIGAARRELRKRINNNEATGEAAP